MLLSHRNTLPSGRLRGKTSSNMAAMSGEIIYLQYLIKSNWTQHWSSQLTKEPAACELTFAWELGFLTFTVPDLDCEEIHNDKKAYKSLKTRLYFKMVKIMEMFKLKEKSF